MSLPVEIIAATRESYDIVSNTHCQGDDDTGNLFVEEDWSVVSLGNDLIDDLWSFDIVMLSDNYHEGERESKDDLLEIISVCPFYGFFHRSVDQRKTERERENWIVISGVFFPASFLLEKMLSASGRGIQGRVKKEESN